MLMPNVMNRDLFDTYFLSPWFDEDWFMDAAQKKHQNRCPEQKKAEWMQTDIRENDKEYLLEMNLPGYEKNDIAVVLEKGYLTVSGKKQSSKEEKPDEQKESAGKYIRRERYIGSCQRSFYVGEALEQNDIRASFKDGILSLIIPKKEAKPKTEEAKCITIEG